MKRSKGAALAALCGLLCALTACQLPQEPQTVDEPAVSAWAEGSQTTEEKPEPEPAPLPEPEPLTQGGGGADLGGGHGRLLRRGGLSGRD